MNQALKKQYAVYELHSTYDIVRPVHKLEPTMPRSRPFDTKEDAEQWILEHAREKVNYTVLEIFSTV